MVVLSHTLLAILLLIALWRITFHIEIGALVGAGVYPLREFQQFYNGDGYGTLAWLIPFLSCLVVYAFLKITGLDKRWL